ncbi:hypothetical protein KIW84_040790 [Lathyrus oleraceus]|uniref:Uncharacterized protein n=1 Tax=Pisum sativum TaxID=3888 RepID=A0A9D4X6Z7_PEA|nr:hypothetical protein KIW84_040790 [Pisum sativum]
MPITPKNVCSWAILLNTRVKCLAPDGKIYISKDVIFNEIKFPYSSMFASTFMSSPNNTQNSIHVPFSFTSFQFNSPSRSPNNTSISVNASSSQNASESSSPTQQPHSSTFESPTLSHASPISFSSLPDSQLPELVSGASNSHSSSSPPTPHIYPLNTHPMVTIAKDGIEVSKVSNGSLFLSPTKYIRDLLAKTNISEAKSLLTPMVSNLKLTRQSSDYLQDPSYYRSVVVALQYATITRTEISFSVNKACQFLAHPLQTHWVAINRILSQVEYRSLASTASEVLWVQSLLSELQVITLSLILYCDNLSIVSLSHNPVLHAKTKHMELDIFFLREKVLNKTFCVKHIPAELQNADILTKPLSALRFLNLRDHLRVVDKTTLH